MCRRVLGRVCWAQLLSSTQTLPLHQLPGSPARCRAPGECSPHTSLSGPVCGAREPSHHPARGSTWGRWFPASSEAPGGAGLQAGPEHTSRSLLQLCCTDTAKERGSSGPGVPANTHSAQCTSFTKHRHTQLQTRTTCWPGTQDTPGARAPAATSGPGAGRAHRVR